MFAASFTGLCLSLLQFPEKKCKPFTVTSEERSHANMFFSKERCLRSVTLLKKDSGTVVFL